MHGDDRKSCILLPHGRKYCMATENITAELLLLHAASSLSDANGGSQKQYKHLKKFAQDAADYLKRN
jgi:hypothetical protein